MMKITLFVSLMLIGMLYARDCKKCGPECERVCRTFRFRPCCNNYFRKKRGPETIEFWTPKSEEHELKAASPGIFVELMPEDYIWSVLGNDNVHVDDRTEDRANI